MQLLRPVAVSDVGATATEQVKPRAARDANAAPPADTDDDSSDTVKQLKKQIAPTSLTAVLSVALLAVAAGVL